MTKAKICFSQSSRPIKGEGTLLGRACRVFIEGKSEAAYVEFLRYDEASKDPNYCEIYLIRLGEAVALNLNHNQVSPLEVEFVNGVGFDGIPQIEKHTEGFPNELERRLKIEILNQLRKIQGETR